MDEHVRRAVTMGLRLRNVDVLTVQEDHLSSRNDDVLLDRATELGRIVFSNDVDFVREAQVRQRAGRTFSGVIYTHQARMTVGQMIDDLELIAKAGKREEFESQVLYLPLR